MRCIYAPIIALLLASTSWSAGLTPDVRLIVDVSDSMATADPEGMRSSAVGVFVEMLPHDSYAGIWTYGRYVNMLVKHAPVDGLWRQVAGIHTADLPSAGLRADLTEAIARASWDRDVTTPDRVRHLVLLTDGKVNIADEAATNAAARARLLNELLPQLKNAGIKVHSLALGIRADVVLLKQLSMATGGYHAKVPSPGKLTEFFIKVLENVAALPRLPIEDQHFLVDPGVVELTIVRMTDNDAERLELITPRGERLSRTSSQPMVRWHTEQRYDLISIKQPQPGSWEFAGTTAKDSRVIVVGDIVPSVSGLNGTLFPGELKAFQLELVGDGQRITDRDFLDLLEIGAVLETPDGEQPLIVERLPDGEYKLVMLGLREQGEHAVRLSISARTFERELRLPFLVSSPVTLDIRPRGSGAVVWAELNAPEVEYGSLRVAAKIKRPPGAAKLFPAESHPGGLWKFTILESRGNVDISLDISGNYLNKKDFKFRSEVVTFRLPLTEPKLVYLDAGGREQRAAAIPIGPLSPSPGPAAESPPAAGAPIAETRGDQNEDEPVADPAPDAEVVATLPFWAGISVALINLGLGFSFWFLLKVPLATDRIDDALAGLKAILGASTRQPV